MILLSKVLFGSVAAATLAGPVVFPDAVDAVRRIAVSVGLAADAEAQPVQAAAPADAPLPQPWQPRCPGHCDVWALMSQIR